MNPYTRTKIEERAAQTEMLRAMQTRASDEKRDLTEAERKTFDELVERINFLDAELARIKSFDEGAAKFADLVGATATAKERAERAHENAENDPDGADGADAEAGKELATRAAFGRRFVESTAFKGYRGAGASERITLPGPASPEFRAALSLGDFALEDYSGPIPSAYTPKGPTFTNTFLDLIGRVATSNSAVTYLRWNPEPPGDAAEVAEGELKPEADMSVEDATVMLRTFAHYKAITRQALEDVPQIQTIVQNRLLAGVRSKLEAEAVAAMIGGAPPPIGGGTLVQTIRASIAAVEANGYAPTAVLVNPGDAAVLDLAAMGVTFNGAVRTGSVWGLPIVSSRAVASGTAYVADWSQAVTWWDRGVTDVYMSDSHSDFFLRNQLVILAEARAGFAVTEPAALSAAAGEVEEPENGGGVLAGPQ